MTPSDSGGGSDRRDGPDGPPPRYEEHGLLGVGGLGEVVEVRDRDLRRRVALKRVREGLADGSAIKRLVEEAQITAQLDHPNITAVHELGVDAQGRPYFTMTRLRGLTLADILARRGEPAVAAEFPLSALMRVFVQVANAVAFAHARGVIHRDLKPSNIMVGAFGEVRVLDWGIAKVIGGAPGGPSAGTTGATSETSATGAPSASATSRTSAAAAQGSPASREAALGLTPPDTVEAAGDRAETRVGAIIGTPGFAPPEQLAGNASGEEGGQPAVDFRADVYSLGAILYAIVAGRPPVAADGLLATVLATLEGDIPQIEPRPGVSPRLIAVIHKALETRREDRYASVGALQEDVDNALWGRPVAALPESKLVQAGRWYTGLSPRMARFRRWDIDFMGGASMGAGAILAVLFPEFFRAWLVPLIVLTIIWWIPPTYTYFRAPRPDDPVPPGTSGDTVTGGTIYTRTP